ncbi:MAG: glycosyltransferase [Paracoccaceae bacterium]|nr:glycosyltransferase [Paracoccaceae bacterium]
MKDSGDPNGAQRIYRSILKDHSQNADVWLQLGHALKLSGDKMGAQEAYERALLLDPSLDGAKAELASDSLARHQSRMHSEIAEGAARDFLPPLVQRLEYLSAEILALRGQVGEISTLRHLSPERFDQFAELHSVPRPRKSFEIGTVHFVGDTYLDPHALHAIVAACHALETSAWTFSAKACEADMRRYATAEPRIRFGAPPETADRDWVVFLGHSRPHPAFCVWLAWAASETKAVGFIFDEVEEKLDGGASVNLRSKPDPEMQFADPITSPYALRAQSIENDGDDLATQLSVLVEKGCIGHIPLPLLARKEDTPTQRMIAAPHTYSDERNIRSITVIIPTRDNADMAERFVESLSEKAANPHEISYILVNNGAERAQAIASLDRLRETSGVTVVDENTPFNWSLLNNRAARMATSDALLFVNDDMQMLSANWDERIASQLSRPEISVVGAKLLFPNDTIQHAGIRLGWRGGSIHEGLEAPRDQGGPGARWTTPRRASAVTGAFMGIRRVTFDDLGGFDAKLMPITHSDLDLCLKARAAGLNILFDSEIELYHFESASRGYDTENHEKQARFEAEKHAFETQWGKAAHHEPGLNPFWSEYNAPFRFISQPTLEKIEGYIHESTSTNIWNIGQEKSNKV